MADFVKDYFDTHNIYDSFNSGDNYKFVLYQANRIIQSQELNNSQLIIRHDLRDILKTVLPNLQILSGGYLKYTQTSVILSETKIYCEGYSILIPEKVFALNLVKDNIIGFKILVNEISSSQDSNLLDKHPKSRNPNIEGATRIQITGLWEINTNVVNSDIFFNVFNFDNYTVSNTTNVTVLDKPEYLRHYDFLTNGNYVVEGFDIQYVKDIKTNFIDNFDFKKWPNGSTIQASSNSIVETSKNWFVDPKTSSVLTSRKDFGLLQTDVPGTPLFYSNFSILNNTNKPEISCKVLDVNNFSFKTIIISGYIRADHSVNLNFFIKQNFGIGGSAEIIKNVGNKIVTSQWSQFNFQVLVPNIIGRVIQEGSYISLNIVNALAEIYNFDLAGVSITNQYLDKGDYHSLSVREGIANVNGSEININNNSNVRVPISSDIFRVSGEVNSFILNTTYSLRKPNTREIIRIFGQKEISSDVAHGLVSGSQDLLPNTPVFSILSVSQNTTTFIQGVDFILNGDKIDWSLSGAEPAPGSTYQVTYRYIEYNIQYSYNPYTNTFVVQDNIVLGTDFYVDYGIVIPRFDRIVLNRYGQISVITGNPNFEGVYPYISNDKGLHLANVEVNYNQAPKVSLVYNRPYKLSDINYLYNTVRDLSDVISDLKLENKSFNSLYTGGEENVEFIDSFNSNSETIDLANSECDIYRNLCTSKVSYQTQNIFHTKNTLPYEIISEYSNYENSNSSLLINADLEDSDKLAYFSVDKYQIKWLTDNTKKILFKDSDFIRDYQTFSKLPSDLAPSFELTFTGWGYGASEFIEVLFDNEIIGKFRSQLNGEFLQTLTVEANKFKSGKRKINIKGLDSKKEFTDFIHLTSVEDSSYVNSFISLPKKEIPKVDTAVSNLDFKNNIFSNSSWIWKGNPIFQSFIYAKDLMLQSLELSIESSNSDLIIYIVECTNGMPDPNKSIGYSFKKFVDLNNNALNIFEFKNPIYIEANKLYSIVVMSATNSASIKTVDLQNDRSIKSNILKDLFISLNNSILIKKSDNELAIKFNTFDFTPNGFNLDYVIAERELATINVTNITDLAILSGLKSFDSSSVSYKIVFLDRSNERYLLESYTNTFFKSYTGRIQILAIFKTQNFKLSSYLDSTLCICLGQVLLNSSYQTKELKFIGDRISLSLTAAKDSDSMIIPQYWNGTSFDNLILDSNRTVDLGSEEIRYFYKDIGTPMPKTKIKILLTSVLNGSRPKISRLRFWYNIPFGGSQYLTFTPNGDVNIENGTLLNVKDGVNASDGVNKGQLNSLHTSISGETTTAIAAMKVVIESELPTQINASVDSKLATLSTNLQSDYNTKINNLSSTLQQEIASVGNNASSEIDSKIAASEIRIDQNVQTQIIQLENSLNSSITQQIDIAEQNILNTVNANIQTVVDNSVNTSFSNIQSSILSQVDSKILADRNSQQTDLESKIALAKTEAINASETFATDADQSIIVNDIPNQISDNNTNNYLLQLENSSRYKKYDGNSSSTLQLIDSNTRTFFEHQIVTTSGPNNEVILPDIADIIAQNSNYNLNIVFKIYNLSSTIPLTIKNLLGQTFNILDVKDTLVLYYDVQASSLVILKNEASVPSGVALLDSSNIFSKSNNFKDDVSFNDVLFYEKSTNNINLPGSLIYNKLVSLSSTYSLSNTSDTFIELYDNRKQFKSKHVVFSNFNLPFYLSNLADFTALKSLFDSNVDSFIFSIHNLGPGDITLSSKDSSDLVQIKLMEQSIATSVVLPPNQEIEFLFRFSDNVLYEI